MSREFKHFCPSCQGVELEIDDQPTVWLAGGEQTIAQAKCLLCGWSGKRSDLFVAIAPENETIWTGDRVANAMLSVAAKYAAAPMVQVLEVIGLVPKLHGSAEEVESARRIREEVAKAVIDAVVTSAFETAARLTPEHYERFDQRMAQSTARAFRYSEVPNDDG